MSLPLFNFAVDANNAVRTNTYRTRSVQFGDSYKQLAPAGINNKLDVWNLTLPMLSDLKVSLVEAFFDALGQHGNFNWLPPRGVMGIYRLIEPIKYQANGISGRVKTWTTVTLSIEKVYIDTSAPINVVPTVNIINGTTGNDTLIGTAGDDIIYGNGGDDNLTGGGGNDTLIAAGNGVNVLDGSSPTLLGVGEHDTLVGGGYGSTNIFVLGNDTGLSYYVGNGNGDYASISRFDAGSDVIVLAGQAADYTLTYTGNVASIFRTVASGPDLVAKIESAPIGLDLVNGSYFYYPQT